MHRRLANLSSALWRALHAQRLLATPITFTGLVMRRGALLETRGAAAWAIRGTRGGMKSAYSGVTAPLSPSPLDAGGARSPFGGGGGAGLAESESDTSESSRVRFNVFAPPEAS
eukprot:3662374-Pleurochrysis_carterae.AAC.2